MSAGRVNLLGLLRVRRGERSRAAIRGTLLVLSALAGFSDVENAKPWELLVAVLVATAISWLDESYATFLVQSDRPQARSQIQSFLTAAANEKGLLTSAIGPGIPILVAAIGPLSLDHAVWVSMGLCVLELFLQGVALARLQNRGRGAEAMSGLFALSLAALIVALKFVVE